SVPPRGERRCPRPDGCGATGGDGAVVAHPDDRARGRSGAHPARAGRRRTGERDPGADGRRDSVWPPVVDGDEHAGRAAGLSTLRRRGAPPRERRGIGVQAGAGGRNGQVTGPLYGLGAAALFGVSVPLAKILVPTTGAVMLAALLYLGAGLGVT